MCGRYCVDDDRTKEIEKLVRQVDEKMKRKVSSCKVEIKAKDIYTMELATILASASSPECRWQRWAFRASTKARSCFEPPYTECTSGVRRENFFS